MISGFNTDIKVGGVVYHVQTEDKGQKSRLLLSLVYDKGTILASKRVSYDDVLTGDFDEKKLAECLNKQHQMICAAVNAGRIDELKEMTGKARSAKAAMQKAAAQPAASGSAVSIAIPPEPVVARATPKPEIPITPVNDFGPVLDAVAIIDEGEMILDAEAVEVVSEFSGRERLSNKKLTVEILGDAKFKGGDRKTLNIMICRGTERKVIAGAEIMVKVLGSSFRPVIFHARSDANGLAKVHLQLPKFDAGRAALLVRAIASGEEIELRRIVTPG